MIRPVPHLRFIVDHDGAVILDVRRDAMSTLNATGAYVWQRLEGGMTIDAIVSALASETGADEITVADDVARFIEELRSEQLVAISR